MMRFSAGRHVSVAVALEDDADSRVDFLAPIYGALWENAVVPENAPPLFTAVP